MDFIVPLLVALVVGFVFGWNVREWYAIRSLHKMMMAAEAAVEEEQEEEKKRTPMRLEKHNDIIFAYSEEDGSFIAQGSDLYALDDAIRARYPDRKFSIKEKNLEEVGVTP